MAKQCAICGVQMNVFQSQKLLDGNYICSKTCMKRGLKSVDYTKINLEQAKAHFDQVELGAKQWARFFVPRLKSADPSQKLKRFKPLYIAEDIGLMAFKEDRYKYIFFGKTEHFCVYRIDDLRGYDIQTSTKMKVSTKGASSKTEFFLFFYFSNVNGMKAFRCKFSRNKCYSMIGYFDSLFGLKSEKKSVYKESQKAAGAMKEAIKGNLVSPYPIENEAAYTEFMKSQGQYKEGDRKVWTERADSALR